MRHRLKDTKLGRTKAHRKALMSSLVCALIEQRQIRTSLQKAKCARSLAEKMVTLARGAGSDPKKKVNAVRKAVSILRRKDSVRSLFEHVVPACMDRSGGYTRIIKVDRRRSDGAEMAILEWVNLRPVERKPKKTSEKTSEKPEKPEEDKKT